MSASQITPVDFYDRFLISKSDGTIQAVSLSDVMRCAKLFLEHKYQATFCEIDKSKITQEFRCR